MLIKPTPLALALSRIYGVMPMPRHTSLHVVPCPACASGQQQRRMTACPRCGGAGRLLAC